MVPVKVVIIATGSAIRNPWLNATATLTLQSQQAAPFTLARRAIRPAGVRLVLAGKEFSEAVSTAFSNAAEAAWTIEAARLNQ